MAESDPRYPCPRSDFSSFTAVEGGPDLRLDVIHVVRLVFRLFRQFKTTLLFRQSRQKIDYRRSFWASDNLFSFDI